MISPLEKERQKASHSASKWPGWKMYCALSSIVNSRWESGPGHAKKEIGFRTLKKSFKGMSRGAIVQHTQPSHAPCEQNKADPKEKRTPWTYCWLKEGLPIPHIKGTQWALLSAPILWLVYLLNSKLRFLCSWEGTTDEPWNAFHRHKCCRGTLSKRVQPRGTVLRICSSCRGIQDYFCVPTARRVGGKGARVWVWEEGGSCFSGP